MIKALVAVILFTLVNLCVYSQNDSTTLTAQSKSVKNIDGPAQMVGGEIAWQKFLNKHVDYDAPAFNGAKEGKYPIRIKFTINENGTLTDFKALTKYGYGLEEEVIRALKKSPNWLPAIRNGVPVSSYRIELVTFDFYEF
jgi:hypothetical protein